MVWWIFQMVAVVLKFSFVLMVFYGGFMGVL